MKRCICCMVSLVLLLALAANLFSCAEDIFMSTTATASIGETTITDVETSAGTAARAEDSESETAMETAETQTETAASSTVQIASEETTATEVLPDGPEEQYVRYRDFGAKGNGTDDDFLAILAAHQYANEHALPVKADEGATYLIAGDSIGKQIDVKTDTDWTGARFIIDDRGVTVDKQKLYAKPIFRIASFKKGRVVSYITSLDKGETNIGFAPGMACAAVIEDKESRVFIRTGIHAGDAPLKISAYPCRQ